MTNRRAFEIAIDAINEVLTNYQEDELLEMPEWAREQIAAISILEQLISACGPVH